MRIVVQDGPFAPGETLDAFTAGQDKSGAIVTFSGHVRDNTAGDLQMLEIEHYPGMTEKALSSMGSEAISRWSLDDALILHRVGRMLPRDPIMMVATAARHRQNAFEAAEFLMDFLKSRAPFWKREITSAGAADWVASRDEDERALTRW